VTTWHLTDAERRRLQFGEVDERVAFAASLPPEQYEAIRDELVDSLNTTREILDSAIESNRRDQAAFREGLLEKPKPNGHADVQPNGHASDAPPLPPIEAYADEPLANGQARINGATSSAEPVAQSDTSDELKILTLDEFVQRPASVSSQVRGVIPQGAIVVVFGPPKGGNTFSVCDLTMHAAHGIDWNGCSIPRRMRVVYLAGEGLRGLRERLKAWLEHHDTLGEQGFFRVLPKALSLPDRASTLVQRLAPLKPDIVVTDTLNTYFGRGDESSTQDMTAFCASVRYLRDELACSVVVIHHTGHGDSGRERGSIVLRATADVLIQVAKDESAGELVGFQVIDARDIESMEAPIALKLSRHQIEWVDDAGVPIESCVVLPANQPVTLPGRGGKKLGDAQATVLQVVQELAKATTPDPGGEVFLVRMDVAQVLKDRHGLKKSTISSAWGPLAKRGYFRLVEPGSIAIRVRT
jgi:hypothetical protein